MSLKNILELETIDEEWSKLFCNTLSTKEFILSSSKEENPVDQTDFQVVVGTGNPPIVRSLSQIITGDVVDLSISASFSNLSGPLNLIGFSNFSFVLTLPHNLAFPTNDTTLMTASITGCIDEIGQPVLFPLSGVVKRDLGLNADQVRCDLVIAGNVSALSATRRADLNIRLKYVKA